MSRRLIKESTYDGILYFGTLMEELRLHELDESGNYPIGFDYLETSAELLLKCQKTTDEVIDQLDQPIKEHLQALGTLLSLLDRAASCVWGCSHSDHILEYITGRVVGYSQSAFFLVRSGLYDEALLLIRSVAEVANLFTLFASDPSSFNEWKALPANKRISSFGPGTVRKRLQAMNMAPPCDKKRYGWLCEVAAHVTPTTKPQLHQPKTRLSVGGIFQHTGFQDVVKEISLAVAHVGIAMIQLADIEDEKSDEVAAQAKTLLSFT